MGRHARLGADRLCRPVRDDDRCVAPLALAAGLVAVLALYRAGSFIHELTHIKKGAVKGFRFVWNLIVGVPLLVPSFMYEGVHNQHHAKTYYGTADDPEYLPLALMQPWTLPVFMVVAVLAPIGLMIRFAILAPLSLVSPKLRALVVGRYSGLQINPRFVRPAPEGEFARDWAWQEAACSVWAIALLAMTATGLIPLRDFLIFLGVASGVMFLNQVRTLVAHLWENDGEPMSVTAQFLDSVNVPAAGHIAGAVGAGRPALSRAPPSASGSALSCAGRGASAAVQGARSPVRSIMRRPIAACRRWSPASPRAAGAAVSGGRDISSGGRGSSHP